MKEWTNELMNLKERNKTSQMYGCCVEATHTGFYKESLDPSTWKY